MDATFLLPMMNELFGALEKGLVRGLSSEFANPSQSPFAAAEPEPVAVPVSAPVAVRAKKRTPARRAPTASPRRRVKAEMTLSAPPEVGTIVRYRQGRGAFTARVVSVDPDGIVTVERAFDGKHVDRPYAKLSPAPQEPVQATTEPMPEPEPAPEVEAIPQAALAPAEPPPEAEPIPQAPPLEVPPPEPAAPTETPPQQT